MLIQAPFRRLAPYRLLVAFITLAGLLLTACRFGAPPETFAILAGSENRTLEPLLERFGRDNNVKVEMTYRGSVDIMLDLEQGTAMPFDAVWPANGIWIAMGDSHNVVRNQQSIMRSPVVLGVKKSGAERLGWVGRDVKVSEILAAAEAGRLRYMMTSATQSNSGASAYLGYLHAFAGNPDVLTAEHLRSPAVREQIKRILGTVNRTAGSSGWLKDLFLERYTTFDAMVNYEAIIIETNQELQRANREPLYVIYPVDGLAIADSPLGYVNKGNANKERIFQRLQEFLLSNEAQRDILALGRRVGPLGLNPEAAPRAVFNPDWGIDLGRVLNPIKFPQTEVIQEALTLYQTAFRKPSFTIFALDFSGSMGGKGEEELKAGMRTLLDQQEAKRYLLQASPDDMTVIITFNDRVTAEWSATGNSPESLGELLAKVYRFGVGGGTNIYAPVIRGLDLVKANPRYEDYATSIILMTDGHSNAGTFAELQQRYNSLRLTDVPVYGVLFGDASETQLKEVATLTSGRIFDGRKNLVEAFREAKGYN